LRPREGVRLQLQILRDHERGCRRGEQDQDE
jgi:hypothetical protein